MIYFSRVHDILSSPPKQGNLAINMKRLCIVDNDEKKAILCL